MGVVHTFKSNVDDTLSAQEDYMTTIRRSSMYEFILIFIIAVIVMVITIRNLMSDTVTPAGYVICCIILILFAIAVIFYVYNLFGAIPFQEASVKDDHSGGPVIRIHYV